MGVNYLPKEFRAIHKACSELILQIEELLVGKEYEFLKVYELDLTKEDKERLEECGDMMVYLEKHKKEHFIQLINRQLVIGLLSDFCYFIEESLDCSKKKRLVISYALLRKILVDNMVILLRIMSDKTFCDKFIGRDDYDPAYAKDDELKALLNKTDEWRMTRSISGAFIYECIFDKNNPDSVINISNRAIHPVTTRPWNKTGAMNLNFMFVTNDDIKGLWKHFYSKMPAILVFYSDLFNWAIFNLFRNDVDEELYLKRMERMLDIITPILDGDGSVLSHFYK